MLSSILTINQNNTSFEQLISLIDIDTINGERFTGLNFCIFHGFQEHRVRFPVNIHFIIQASYNGIVLVL